MAGKCQLIQIFSIQASEYRFEFLLQTVLIKHAPVGRGGHRKSIQNADSPFAQSTIKLTQ